MQSKRTISSGCFLSAAPLMLSMLQLFSVAQMYHVLFKFQPFHAFSVPGKESFWKNCCEQMPEYEKPL